MFASLSGYLAYKQLPQAQRQLVFYAESRHDWHHFADIISRLLTDYQHDIVYLTSDQDDLCFQQSHPQLHCFYIGEGFIRTWAFQFLKAKLVVLTVMDLDNLQLKRSIHPVHYLYIFHSPGSTHRADFANSYDHYDSILCVGPYHIEEIRQREQLANLPAKELIEHGYQRLETLHALAKAQSKSANPDKPCALIAPTWGEGSLVKDCALELIDNLLAADIKVIFRPHYQTVKLDKAVCKQIIERFSNHPNFELVTLMGETDSLLTADVLIADWSAIAIEFALALQKPVLFIDVPPRVRNQDWQQYHLPVMENEIRHHIGKVLSPTQLTDAAQMVKDLCLNQGQIKDSITTWRSENIFNFGKSVEVAAQAIDQKLIALTTEKVQHAEQRNSASQ